MGSQVASGSHAATAGADGAARAAELAVRLMGALLTGPDGDDVRELVDGACSWCGITGPIPERGPAGAGVLGRSLGGVTCAPEDLQVEVDPVAPGVHLCRVQAAAAVGAGQGGLRLCASMVVRDDPATPRCIHVHLSCPVTSLPAPEDVGDAEDAPEISLAGWLRELERRSFEDALTGLFNRAKFNEVMYGDVAAHRRLGVAYFDINGLKATNDHLGHRAGDDLIRSVARRLAAHFPGMVYRVGGDEFVVIAEEADRAEFSAAVERACRDMAEAGISISSGISWRRADCDVEEQFEEADASMYEQKARYYRAVGDRRLR